MTTTIINVLWDALNSPGGLTAMAGLFVWLGRKICRPAWKDYEGTIVSAIRLAEKQIPDGTENKGLAKLDTALEYVLKVYEESRGKLASSAVQESIREGIQIKHDEMVGKGSL